MKRQKETTRTRRFVHVLKDLPNKNQIDYDDMCLSAHFTALALCSMCIPSLNATHFQLDKNVSTQKRAYIIKCIDRKRKFVVDPTLLLYVLFLLLFLLSSCFCARL